MDFDLMSEVIQAVPRHPSHHKKHSTFANVPFAETQGLDDFIGFSVEETHLNQELIDLKQKLKENEEEMAKKDEIIDALRTENNALKNTVNELKLQYQRQHGLKSRDSQSVDNNTPTDDILDDVLQQSNGADVIGHAISASLDNFLDNLDFKFKEEEDHDIDIDKFIDKEKEEDGDKDTDEYIYNPSAAVDIDGHLPQLRRSSLSKEEEKQMEMEVIKEIQRRTESMTNGELQNVSNVIFNDANVNNMNMSIVNHHNHSHNDTDSTNNIIINNVNKEIESLKHEIEQMRTAKIQLVITTSNEINNLRAIIRKHIT